MKLAWSTDIHLNFLDADERQKFYQKIIELKSDAAIISGDIAEAPSVVSLLIEMADHINLPIYFVLGNHDYYRGQVSEVRKAVTTLTDSHKNLFWLPAAGIQKLKKSLILVGQDGWADGRFGDYQRSPVVLNDSRMIADLFQAKILGKLPLLEKMQQLADRDAEQLKIDLIAALNENPKDVLVLTHVPPFREACMHQGQISDDDWLPYFSSKAIGDVLLEIAQQHSSVNFLVLCGHTHSEANYSPLNNLTVRAGNAEYYHPQVHEFVL